MFFENLRLMLLDSTKGSQGQYLGEKYIPDNEQKENEIFISEKAVVGI